MRIPFLILGLLPALLLAAVACGEDAPIPTSVPTADRAQTAAPETTEVPAPIPTSAPTPDRAQTATPETTEVPAPIPTSAPTPDRAQTATPETTEVPAPIPTSAPTPERAQTATPEATEVPAPIPTSAPTPERAETVTPETTEVPAPIDGVELNIAESDPPQYFLEVTSGLPDACHTFERIETQRAGTEITVTVINRVLTGDIACAQVYETESSTMFLGSEFEADVTYTVRVNDWETSFTTEAAAVEVEAPIEDVTLNIVESDPPQYFLEIVSGLPTTCHILERNDVNQLPWEEVMVTVVNRVAATGPACAESGETKTTVVPLRSGFRPSETYGGRVNDWVMLLTPESAIARFATPKAATTAVPAPIESVNLYAWLGFGLPEYSLKIVSSLPTLCHVFDQAETQRSETEIAVAVMNRFAPGGEACTEISQSQTTWVDLGRDLDLGVTYTVRVNDWNTSFTAEPEPIEVEASVEDVVIRMGDPTPGHYLAVTYRLPNTCHIPDRPTVQERGRKITVTAITRVFASGDACGDIDSTVTFFVWVGYLDWNATYSLQVNDWEAPFTNDPTEQLGGIPIKDVSINVDESDPQRYVLEITHGPRLYGHCYSVDPVVQGLLAPPWAEGTYRVSLHARPDERGGCSETDEPKTTVVKLTHDFQPGALYTIQVNDSTIFFTRAPQPIPEVYGPLPHYYGSPFLEAPTVRPTKSQPRRYFLDSVVEFVPGCNEMDRTDLRQSGDNIHFRAILLDYWWPNAHCDLFFGYRYSIDLGSDFERGVTYTVYSQGRVVAQFTAE